MSLRDKFTPYLLHLLALPDGVDGCLKLLPTNKTHLVNVNPFSLEIRKARKDIVYKFPNTILGSRESFEILKLLPFLNRMTLDRARSLTRRS